MTDADDVARQLAGVTSARSETAVFVRMDDRFAVVNIGTATVTVPCVGFYPPVAGMSVRLDWVNGSPAVTGPVKPLNPIGRITATGTPRATVTVDGIAYLLYYRSGYTPAVNDDVEINWATGIIQGKVTGLNTPAPPVESGGGATPFDVTVRAAGSGRYQSGWWGNDPWASSNNSGIWVYGSAAAGAVGAGTVHTCYIYLPLISEVGLASIGVHGYASIPGGAPSISSLVPMPLGGRAGWVPLTTAVGQYLASGAGGVGVLAPGGGGFSKWRGTASDAMSGALRFTGVR